MVRVKGYKHGAKRQKLYYKAQCPYCESWLIFEFGDIWWDDPLLEIGRIECPICRTKVHIGTDETNNKILPIAVIKNATEKEYNNALSDTSKSGLELLMAEKHKEKDEHGIKNQPWVYHQMGS